MVVEAHYVFDDDGNQQYPWLYYLVNGSQLIDGSQHRARTEQAAIDGARHLWQVHHGLAVNDEYPRYEGDFRKGMK